MRNLTWKGPKDFFSDNNNIFDDKAAQVPGVYLWTVLVGDIYYVNYVGESSNIANRQRGHLEYYQIGKYRIYEPDDFAKTKKNAIYEPPSPVESFIKKYNNIANKFIDFISLYRLFFAPTEVEKKGETKMLKRIESALISELRNAGKSTSDFLDNGNISIKIPDDKKIPLTMDFPYNIKIDGLTGNISV